MRSLEPAFLKNAIKDLPVETFSQIDKHRQQTAVAYLYDTPLDPFNVNIAKTQNYNLFNLYSLSSLTVIFAYLFVFDNKQVVVKDKYVEIKRPSSANLETYTGTELIYQSNFINIYNSQDGACLISANKLFNVVDKSMVRKSQKSEEQ